MHGCTNQAFLHRMLTRGEDVAVGRVGAHGFDAAVVASELTHAARRGGVPQVHTLVARSSQHPLILLQMGNSRQIRITGTLTAVFFKSSRASRVLCCRAHEQHLQVTHARLPPPLIFCCMLQGLLVMGCSACAELGRYGPELCWTCILRAKQAISATRVWTLALAAA